MKKDHLEILIQWLLRKRPKKVNWNEALTLSEENPNSSSKSFVNIVDRVIDKHCSEKPIPKT